MKYLPLLAALTLTGCVVEEPYHEHRSYGPPPHAPAYGYRKKFHGYDMDYDPGLGVYVMVGYPGYYYWNDQYWRLIDGHWHMSLAFGGPWNVVAVERVPVYLYKKYPGKPYKKGYERGYSAGYRDGYHDGDHDDDHHGHGKGKGKGKGKGHD